VAVENVRGFSLRTDLAYDCVHHMWVEVLSSGRVRIGMDPLGLETSGTLAQLDLLAVGVSFARGEHFGSLEAEKFVGPLVAPVSGRITAVNDEAIVNPGFIENDPFGAGWMIEVEPAALDDEIPLLTSGADEVVSTFEVKIDEYRRDGVLAE